MKQVSMMFASLLFIPSLAFANVENTADYKDAYKCAMEAYASDFSSAASFCLGNSRDPSEDEELAYAAAKRDYAKQAKAVANSCNFAYAVWIANGSRADGFLEGPQQATSLKEVANLLPGRENMQFFDQSKQPIPPAVVQSWFTMQNGEPVVSKQALKTCSKKQIG